MNKPFIRIIFLLSSLLLLSKGFCQDGHYWSEQFGNKSMLLSGTVNASVMDLGLVFYNPGRLSQIENPAFVISAKVYELIRIKITDGLGEGEDLKRSVFGGAPNLVAGTFKIPFLKNQQFAYSFLTRYRQNSEFNTRTSEEDQEIDEIYYDHLSAKLFARTKFQEEWFGLTWSHKINNHLSLGLSTFGTLTNSSNAIEIRLQGLTDEDEVHIANFKRELNTDLYGILWKAGLAGQWGKFNIGLTVTTPRINISGKGSSTYEDYISGLSELENEPVDDKFVENYQNNIPVSLKSALAVGLGTSFRLNKSRIHFSSEWYNNIREYTIMESESFLSQSTGDTIYFRLVDELKSVFNFGIGIEHNFNEKVQVYGSFATDFSAVKSDAGYLYKFENNVANSRFDSDIIHFGGGISLNLPWAELTLGATYGSAKRQIPRPLNIGGDQIFDSNTFSDLKYNRWRFLIGFSFPFANKLTDKLNKDGNE